MAVRPIKITGEPTLHEAAEPVTVFDETLRTLVADLYETMDEAPGVGLAGPQVGVPLRVFVFSYTDDAGELHRGEAINPVLWQTPLAIDPLDDDDEAEGCLSIPGERFALRRSEGAILRAVDLENEPFEIEAHGWLARIFQHEFDHLDGILYSDRLEHPSSKAVAKVIRKKSWGVPGREWTPGVDHPEG